MADETIKSGQNRFDINASGSAQVNAFGTFTAETVNFGRQGSILSPNIDPVPPVGQLQKLRQEQTWIDCPQVQTFLQQRLIENPIPLVELIGVAGSGKSMMVTWAFERILSGREQGGTGFEQAVWLNVGLQPSFQDLGRSIYQSIHLPTPDEQTSDQVLQRYLIAALIQRRYLVVIDQVETVMATEAWPTLREFFEAWQSQGYNSVLLLTSREPVLPGPTHRFDFQGFTAAEGAEYLRRRGVPETGTVTLEEVAILAQGNPLLLQLVVTELQQPTGNPFEQVVALFQRHLGSTETQVGKVFEILLGRLAPLHREVLLRVGVYRREFDLAQAQAMVAATTAADLTELTGKGFLMIQEERWTLHPLIRQLVSKSLKTEKKDRTAHQKAINYFSGKFQQGFFYLEDVLDCFYHYCELGNYNIAFDFISSFSSSLYRQGFYRTLDEVYRRLLVGWQTRSPEDEHGKQLFAESLNWLYIAQHSLCEYRKSIEIQIQALELNREIQDRAGEARSLENLGIAHRSLGEFNLALGTGQLKDDD